MSCFVDKFCFCLCADGGLMTRDSLPTQSTTLEALLRGEGLDKRNSSKNDEESLLEIQVCVWHLKCLKCSERSL